MKKITTLVLAVILVLFGCVPSLHELYTEETLIFDPNIAGKWYVENEIWEFVPEAEKKTYTLNIYKNKEKNCELSTHLVNVKGQRFFDFYPLEDATIKPGECVEMCVVPIHLFVHVNQTEPNLVLAMMNIETIDKLLKEKPDMIKHERIENGCVLTDTPEHLQAFVTAGLSIKNFYIGPIVLERTKPADPKTP